jgi:hypothetical protein
LWGGPGLEHRGKFRCLSIMTDGKWKVIRPALWVGLMLMLAYGVVVYRRFHDRYAWIERSPVNPRWAVDCIGAGFGDLGFHFRVHDFQMSRLRPLLICDLYWEDRYWPNQLHWSEDGSVAAITVSFSSRTTAGGEFYACAYDFREHKSYRSGSFGGPLEPTPELSHSIAQLIASRGGRAKPIEVPDVTKMYIE